MSVYTVWSSHLDPRTFKRGRPWILFSIFLENNKRVSKWQLEFLYSSPQTHKSSGRNSGSQKPHIVKGHLKVISYIPRQAVQTGFRCFYEAALQGSIKNLHYWDLLPYLCVAVYFWFKSFLIKKNKARCPNIIMVKLFDTLRPRSEDF